MNDDLHELAALYAAGALPADEAARFEERLATDEAARRAVAAHDETLVRLFRAAPPVEPSPGVREALLKRVGRVEAAIEPPGFEALGTARIGSGLADDGGELLEVFGKAFLARLAIEQT